jgi:Tfp pilus assembly protein PilF
MNLRDSVLAAIFSLAAAGPVYAATADDAGALVAQARAASARGETDLALRMAQAAIVADPSRPTSYDALADVYSADHQPDAARYYYDQALAIDPSDDGAIKAIAALDRAGDTRKADASDGAKPGLP